MSEDTLLMALILVMVVIMAIAYTIGVVTAQRYMTRLPFFCLMFVGGNLIGLIPDSFYESLDMEGFLSMTAVFTALVGASGWIVGSRLNDAGLSKWHAVWGGMPLVWIILSLIPTRK